MTIQYSSELKQMLHRALADTSGFWGEMAGRLHWFKAWTKVYEASLPNFTWFVGGETNISYNAVDHQVKSGLDNKPAIIWESGETGSGSVLTFSQLQKETKKFAAALRALDVKKGDRVAIYMPMIPEAAIAMLACTRIGAIHCVVFSGFGPSALCDRIVDSGSEVLVTADVGYRRGFEIPLKETAEQALRSCHNVRKTVVVKRSAKDSVMKPGRDLYWNEALELGKSTDSGHVSMEANEPAFILYTSGTTAKPKGTVQPHGSYQVYIHAMSRWVYDMRGDDVWWCTSDIGWIGGHSYVIYAPLLVGCPTIMYEGTPDYSSPDTWWRIVEKHRVSKMLVSPTDIRELMKAGDEWSSKHDIGSVKLVACAGEALNPKALEWIKKDVFKNRVPIVDHMWQTESAGPMIGNPAGVGLLPIKAGSAGIPLPGIDADIVDEEGKTVAVGVRGNFVCRRPFPGLTPTLWSDHRRYVHDYWERIKGYYSTGDAAMRDKDGYYWFLGRTDDVIKISGRRIAATEIENILAEHPSVAEVAVVGRPDHARGEVAAAFVVLKPEETPSEKLRLELIERVRRSLGRIVMMGSLEFVKSLPKTQNGKTMRRLIKTIISGQPYEDYSAIGDEAAIDEVKRAVDQLHISPKKKQ